LTASSAAAGPLPATGISLGNARLVRAVFRLLCKAPPPRQFGLDLVQLFADRGLYAACVFDLGVEFGVERGVLPCARSPAARASPPAPE